jgi:hypothetical protein
VKVYPTSNCADSALGGNAAKRVPIHRPNRSHSNGSSTPEWVFVERATPTKIRRARFTPFHSDSAEGRAARALFFCKNAKEENKKKTF